MCVDTLAACGPRAFVRGLCVWVRVQGFSPPDQAEWDPAGDRGFLCFRRKEPEKILDHKFFWTASPQGEVPRWVWTPPWSLKKIL